MGAISEKLKNEIYPLLTHQMIFSDREVHDKGKYVVVDCPECGRKEKFYAYHGNHYGSCNVISCGYRISWWDYVQNRYGITGVSDRDINKEMLRKFAELAGVYLPPDDPHHASRANAAPTVYSLQRDFFQWGREILFSKEAAPLLQKIMDRGLTREEIEKSTEICAMPNRKEFKQHFIEKKGFNKDQIKESGLGTWGFGYNYQILFPHRNEKGQIISWAGWLTQPGVDMEGNSLPKYKNALGFLKEVPFYLSNARQAIAHSKKVILVEGFFDAIHPFAKGFRNIVSLLGNRLLPSQLDHLKTAGAEQILLCLDRDKEGEAGTEWAMELLLKHPDLKPYYIILPPDCKDADETIKKYGKEAFADMLKGQPGWHWYAERLGRQFDNSTDRDAQLSHYGKIYNRIEDPVMKNEFMKTLSRQIQVGVLTLRKKFGALKHPETDHARQTLLEDYEKFLLGVKAVFETETHLREVWKLLDQKRSHTTFSSRNPWDKRFKEYLKNSLSLCRQFDREGMKGLTRQEIAWVEEQNGSKRQPGHKRTI